MNPGRLPGGDAPQHPRSGWAEPRAASPKHRCPFSTPTPGTLNARNLGGGTRASRTLRTMEQERGPGAEADAPEEEEEGESQAAMAAVVPAAGRACPAVLQVAGLYRGLCAVRSRALGLGFVSPAQLRVFPVRRGSGLPSGGADGSGVSELEANPFYDRYRDKIQQLRRCGPGRVRVGTSGARAELPACATLLPRGLGLSPLYQ